MPFEYSIFNGTPSQLRKPTPPNAVYPPFLLNNCYVLYQFELIMKLDKTFSEKNGRNTFSLLLLVLYLFMHMGEI